MLFITFINNLTDGRDYILGKFEGGTTLGGMTDMLKWRAVFQRSSAVQRNELMGALSLAERNLAMLSGSSGLGSSSAAKVLGFQWTAKEDMSAEDLVTWAVLTRVQAVSLGKPDRHVCTGLQQNTAKVRDVRACDMWDKTENWVCSGQRKGGIEEIILRSTST